MNTDNLLKAIDQLNQSFESSTAATDILMDLLTAAMGSEWSKISDKNDLSDATALCWRLSNIIREAEAFRKQ